MINKYNLFVSPLPGTSNKNKSIYNSNLNGLLPLYDKIKIQKNKKNTSGLYIQFHIWKKVYITI